MPDEQSRASSMAAVARAARVSKATVSLALRRQPGIAPSTAERVRQVARRMGYRINPLLSVLMTQQRQGKGAPGAPAIGLVEIYPGAEAGTKQHLDRGHRATLAAATETGYRLNRFSVYDLRTMTPGRLLQIVRSRGIRGIILVHGGNLPAEWRLDWEEFCVIELASPQPVFHSVKVDYITSGRLLLAELVRRGYRRIGWFVAHSNDAYSGFRWRLVFEEHNLTLPFRDRVPPMADTVYTRESFLAWLRRYQPDAVVTAGATELAWLQEAGIRAPEDVGLAAINLLPEHFGRIAGLDTCYDERMAEAVHVLDGLLRRNQTGRPATPMTVIVPARWVDGPTVRPAPPGP